MPIIPIDVDPDDIRFLVAHHMALATADDERVRGVAVRILHATVAAITNPSDDVDHDHQGGACPSCGTPQAHRFGCPRGAADDHDNNGARDAIDRATGIYDDARSGAIRGNAATRGPARHSPADVDRDGLD